MTVESEPRTALAAIEPLVFRRLRMGAAEPFDLSILGGRWVGPSAEALDAKLLQGDNAVFDSWTGGARVKHRSHGCVRYATDGQWLHGCAEIDDRETGLRRAAQAAYADLFALLDANDCPHLLRLWNYFADINLDAGAKTKAAEDRSPIGDVESIDGERYRQFNIGRQQAFIEAQRSAFDGAPAACALGTHGGPLRVYFLAGKKPPIAIENPRQISAYRYPGTYGSRTPTFSRAALVDVGEGRQALFISGTASIVGHASVHVGDVRRQTEESLANIAVVRAAASERAGTAFAADEAFYTVYVRNADDLPVVREAFECSIGVTSMAAREAVYLQADICRADLLVEIEAHAFTAAATPSSDRIGAFNLPSGRSSF